MITLSTEKFWIVNDLEKLLLEKGTSSDIIDISTFVCAIIILFIVLWLLDFVFNKLILKILHHAAARTKTQWDDMLVQRHFFRHVLRFVLSILVVMLIEHLLKGYSRNVVEGVLIITKCISIVFILTSISAFLNAAHDIYLTLPQSKEKSIKGYIQSAKIIIFLIGILFICSVLFSVKIQNILVAIATSAAIFTLIFKDTILGFVASIQLTAQDMVRLGDWIEMKSKGADGTVIDISINTVKVQNWDNTVSMIPIYSMVSESFVNWRAMERSKGRRFIRPISFDNNSIKFLVDSDIIDIGNHPLIIDVFNTIKSDATTPFKGGMTNLSLYRSYLNHYINDHSAINKSLPLIIRYKPISDMGITLEIYAFTYERGFIQQEIILNEITEHIIASSKIFGLHIYQRSSGIIIS